MATLHMQKNLTTGNIVAMQETKFTGTKNHKINFNCEL